MFLLRTFQVGLSLSDLDRMEQGEVTDLIIESGNDHHKYRQIATQEDMDRF